MAALVCDICGGKLIMKDGGIAVCDSCGMEHSVERVREKIQEVKGTVFVDNSPLIGNYLEMVKGALEAGNESTAEQYCNKILEIDITHYEAWSLKGKAVGWQSTLGNSRMDEAVSCFKKAVENSPEDKKSEVKDSCAEMLSTLYKALFTSRMKTFMNSPAKSDLTGLQMDVVSYISVSSAFFSDDEAYNFLSFELGFIILNTVISLFPSNIEAPYSGSGHPGDYEFRNYVSEGDLCIEALKIAAALFGEYETKDKNVNDCRALTYSTMITLNKKVRDACSWNYMGGRSLSLTAEAKRARNTNNEQWEKKKRQFGGT